jgi:alpha-mannosidase
VRGEREITRQRVKKYLGQVIRPAIESSSTPLAISVRHLAGEPEPPVDALAPSVAAEFVACQVGEALGGSWATTWLRLEGSVPPEWAGSEVRAAVDLGYRGQPGFGAEALIFEGERAAGAINSRHRDHTITAQARGGEPVLLHLEVASNPAVPWGALEWPLLGPDYDGEPPYRLRRADLVRVDGDVESAYHDLRVLFELAEALSPDDHRVAEILTVLDGVCSAIDIADVRGSLAAARPRWSALLERSAATSAHLVTASGHAHIDTAWLWPLRETPRKCARTFATVLGLMDRDSEMRFACSQAQQHAFVEAAYPELFERIKKQVAAGRFEPVGSMWVEPDTNVPSGESLVRQIVHGKRFFRDRYGVETVDLFLPDAFGYSAALPQILRKAGVEYFLTQKLSWNEVDAFPHHTFWWEGLDGSRVLAHCPPTDTYNADFSAGQVLEGVRQFAEHGHSRRSLYLYGHGDGGGGPTREMLESARRMADLDGFPRIEHGSVREFFETVASEADSGLPVWCGELYLERHRGVFTTQAAGKLGNRRCEDLLRAAELWSAVAAGATAGEDGHPAGLVPLAHYPATRIDQAWKTLLLHQFHDILPGSSINWVHREQRATYEALSAELRAIVHEALASLAERIDTARAPRPVIVFNAATHSLRSIVELGAPTGPVPAVAADVTGHAEPVQDIGDGRIIFSAAAPGCGWARYDLVTAAPGRPTEPGAPTGSYDEDEAARVELSGSLAVLSNGLVTVTVDEDGLLGAVHDEIHDRAVLAPDERGNLFQLHHDLPNDTDAWDVDRAYLDSVEDLIGGIESIEVVESGPVRAALRVVRRFGADGRSRIDQLIRVSAHSRRIEFVTEVDWHEEHRFLKVAFPVAVRSLSADYEVQFGYVQRPTHENTSWDKARFEVPAQRWANLGETGYGVALLNDCKYGYDIRGKVIRLSLLRSSTWPDPEADRGHHSFRYALLAHGGDLATGLVAEEAENFNLGLSAVATTSHTATLPARCAPIGIGQPGIFLSAAKRAEDSDDLVIRLYEAYGGRGEIAVELAAPFRARVTEAHRVDLLESDLPEGEVAFDGGQLVLAFDPFELSTLRLSSSAAS